MSLPKRVVLVGPMGAGKSTIGRLLARELGYRFLDSDRIIEERCGANIPWIFDVEGEDGFRQRETSMLEELSNEVGTVLATGGGAVMRAENHGLLKKNAVVVYLKTSIDQQVERTRKDRNRPLLQNDDPEGVLRRLFAIRDPLYTELADIVMFTDRKSPRLVVRQLVNRINPKTPRHRRQRRKEGRHNAQGTSRAEG
ncbi:MULTISPECIES: shikimate kinase AroK [Marinobacter]|jgi:shikimate kinase|uniref:shikimate kinase AroK n=1 Tax=Marinobacter TaxID=2742 RepID=UPI000256E825|nr:MULTISPECIES: shikimate kinase AroK [Marinobacter]MCG8521340.1 shikimate kinase AroK [Pseudomonadales bacterium]MEC8898194.1 shikimate kinase AroK [Pseudomonadota bacterium]MAC24335.1 shikimate kinase AroK [Marinobacter sp.]MBH92534.1 shikimate kinase AroK [Marinobacter sp.]MEC9387586.1 shikimate kinase AroK [Pseudomonadota bacterium]|tara:strand:- start:32 stop:622 length:591 start_codon:yes stop_codon:yes gene_type:complete